VRTLRAVHPTEMPLALTALVAVLGLLTAAAQHSTFSFVAYWVVLLVCTGLVAYHRWLEARLSLSPDHVMPPRWRRRLALLPVALFLLACMANALVWATEAAKR
jgi:hypothetical protein